MAILSNIRKNAGNTFVAVVVVLLIIMFLSSDIRGIFFYLFGNSKAQIGTVAGEKISYTDYRKLHEEIYRNVKSQGKPLTTEEQIRLKSKVWRKLVEDMLYAKEIKQIGMVGSANELVDLVQGKHIDTRIQSWFKDPETGTFDQQKLLTFLDNLSKDERAKLWWCQVEKELAITRAKEKLHQLMLQSCFVTSAEEKQNRQHASTLRDVDYLYIPFTTVSDDLVVPTDQQLQDYMAAHRSHYKASESRSIMYITFPVKPDEKDSADFKEELSSLAVQFSTAADPYIFAEQHTDGTVEATRLECIADDLPAALAKMHHTLAKDMVVGPIMENGSYMFYRVMAIKKEKTSYQYQIAVIEKKMMISDYTRNKCFRKVQHLTASIKNLNDLQTFAANEKVAIQKEEVAPSDESIGAYAAAREVVRWLYNEATVGKVSKIFDLGEVYLLAVMFDQVKAGDLVPLHSVRNAVYRKVLHQEKAKIILDKLKQIQSNTLSSIAEQYGNHIAVQSVERLSFLENDHKHFRKAKAFVGTCFGLSTGSISPPIIDEEGVFMAYVKKKYNKETECLDQPDASMKQIERWMQPFYVSKSLEELAKVIDQRYKYE
ncbi:peptidylprolyl isomerase [Candidatus Cardinium hertigii]|uniref:PpiC domain-containing protein n=1 Tax=Candidatus Cardinium hertigii TaxID=247481 RepID=A0A3N2QCF0_9BACT|nr:SurA N-terminal domain-containing protein [Candidatus Cardinium hertigii]ROT47476.1 hypothetical protein EDM02_02370 [Candidatus Cardinium hertigii]